MGTYLERAMAKLETDRATNMELRKSMILAPSPRQWWEKETVEFAFAHPHVRNRLERLMGSNIVRITDRRYMQRLQERIYEDHLEQQRKQMKDRELQEIDREKRLILCGKMPMQDAHIDLQTHHPVLKVHRLAAEMIRDHQVKIPVMPEGASIFDILFDEAIDDEEKAEVTGLTPSKFKERISMLSRGSSMGGDEDAEVVAATVKSLLEGHDDVARGYMFSDEEYDRLKYKAPLIRLHKKAETVDEMYRLADEIVGALRTMKSTVPISQRNTK